MSKVDFSISYAEIDSDSPINQNEAHIHKACEIYLNLSGDVSFAVENHIYPISRGSVIITRPFEYHHCIYHSNQPHRHFWITFSAERKEDFLKIFFDREKGKNNLIILDENQLNECCLVLNGLLENKTDSLSRRILFLKLLHILRNGRSSGSIDNTDKMPQAVALALHYMENHLAEDFDIKTLSAACNVSPNTLERHFKEALGITPFAMLRKKRLLASMEFLIDGESITAAALKSGFSDYSNYIQLFRKQFGLTPLQYKKKYLR
ncbi:MAG: helix-turn-helix transcriptional regulator [Clostridia bacterium]|nr:helix-turn-helix transcriptional regulator [Clostridia bacterium]